MTGDTESLTVNNAVINDVLCYISTARDSLAKDVIVMNACAYYRAEKILQAKELIHNIFCEKMVTRRRSPNQPNTASIDLHDIMNIFDKYDGNCPVKFLASSYDSLPPSGFEPMAAIISSLRDEMLALRTELLQIKENNVRDQQALEDVLCIKEDVGDIKLQIRSMRSSAVNPQVSSRSQVSHDYDEDATNSVNSAPVSGKTELPVRYAAAVAAGSASSAPMSHVSSKVEKSMVRNIESAQSTVVQGTTTESEQPAWQLVTRKRKNFQQRPKITGTSGALNSNLTAASQLERSLDIFVGGCSLQSTTDDISNHLTAMNITVRDLSSLDTKATWYRAYKLTVQACDRDKLMVPEAWPEGIFVRKYFKPRNAVRR